MLKNQHGHWLDRTMNWAENCPPGQRFKTPHRDVAINQLVELNARDISLRAMVEAVEMDDCRAGAETAVASTC